MKWKFWKKNAVPDEGWLWNRVCVNCNERKLVNITHICRECKT